MIFIIFILIFFITPSSVKAQEIIPYQSNPIISNEATHNGAVQPFVLREQDSYSLWYADTTSGYQIVRVKSSNGIDWYDKKNTYVTNRKNASDPFVLYENGKYNLFFASSNSGSISLWESESTDGITFETGGEKEILKSEKQWEGTNLSCPSVIKENNLYYLFYSGSGVENWGIGLATSSDGQNWQKCQNNPFIAPGASEHIIKYNGIFYLYFQSPNGLEVQQSNLLDGCDTVWTNRHITNSTLRDPSPIQVGNNLWIYGTLPTTTGYHIGLAAYTTIPDPTYPIVIIPGMFSSWNKDAILHNSEVSFDAWKINPGVVEYSALEKTLENIGRIKNSDYYIFPYDWRASLSKTVSNLDQFLENTIWTAHPYLPVQLIGHSLGGVITNLYARNNETKPIKNIITAGSPLSGTLQSYKPLAGGEIDRENTLMWIAEKLILLLNKSQVESDKETITRTFPVLKNLLPTFSYLKNEEGTTITSLLSNETLSFTEINSSIKQLHLGGSGYLTNAGYILGERTSLDTLLNIYPDGHPINSWKEDGDGVVLLKSTANQVSPAPISNHGEVIFSKENIKTILSSLKVQVEDSEIPDGKTTQIFPALLIFVKSPATMEIKYGNISQRDSEGLIWLQNTKNGEYTLEVTGTEEGEYITNIWLIGEIEDRWFQFQKQTSSGLKDKFIIAFNTTTGGTAKEYVTPSPTAIPSPTSAPSPTKNPSPTIKPHVTPSKTPPIHIQPHSPHYLSPPTVFIKQIWLHLRVKIRKMITKTIKQLIPPYPPRR